MALDIIFILLLVCWGIVLVGFKEKDYAITVLGSFFLMVWGIHCIIYGLLGTQDFLTESFGVINLAISFYIMVVGSYEQYKDY